MKQTIAIQGFEGSFHQEAAIMFFGENTQVIPCNTFRKLIKTVQEDSTVNGAMMAIENSIAGSILPNYNLLQNSNLQVVGEVYLHIAQQLIVNKGVRLEDIKEVHSHPMALLQCADYLDQFPWKIVENDDTALSVRMIKEKKCKHTAAIASKLAAKLYDTIVITPDIHTQSNNYTRFLALKKNDEQMTDKEANKSSLYFQTDHSKGSLAKVLDIIASEDINLSKLQSFPIPGSDWKYSFHADMEFDSLDAFTTVINKMKPLTEFMRIYGIYKNGKGK